MSTQETPKENAISRENIKEERELRTYKDLVAWQKAHSLALKVYDVSSVFPKEELIGITLTLKQLTASIPSLLVEGYNSHDRGRYIDCLEQALSKLSQLEYLLFLSRELKFLPKNLYEETEKLRQEVNFMFIRLLDSIKRRNTRSSHRNYDK